jgi:hypothetical protein
VPLLQPKPQQPKPQQLKVPLLQPQPKLEAAASETRESVNG